MSHSRYLFITGGSGFVGKALLALLLQEQKQQKILLLLRPGKGLNIEQRMLGLLSDIVAPAKLAEAQARVKVLSGDLTCSGLGLSESDLEFLMEHTDRILHIGASTDFGAPLDESRASNVEGTRRVLEIASGLADRGRLKRFDYVSTAFVAGRSNGIAREGDLDRQQTFSNAYEQSKFEAEVLVRAYARRLPITIYRPSIIVGDSRHGYTPHFNVLYWPLLILAKGLVPFVTFNRKAMLDIVPVDYVAKSMLHLMSTPQSIGETYHLTAGLGREVPAALVLKDAYRFAGVPWRPLIPPSILLFLRHTRLSRLFHPRIWATVDLARPYYSYLLGKSTRFDSTRTEQVLAPMGIKPPVWREYGRIIMKYCLESRWGRSKGAALHRYYYG